MFGLPFSNVWCKCSDSIIGASKDSIESFTSNSQSTRTSISLKWLITKVNCLILLFMSPDWSNICIEQQYCHISSSLASRSQFFTIFVILCRSWFFCWFVLYYFLIIFLYLFLFLFFFFLLLLFLSCQLFNFIFGYIFFHHFLSFTIQFLNFFNCFWLHAEFLKLFSLFIDFVYFLVYFVLFLMFLCAFLYRFQQTLQVWNGVLFFLVHLFFNL